MRRASVARFYDCGDVLTKDLLNRAWGHKLPEDAVVCGKELLAAADAAESSTGVPKRRSNLFTRLGLAKEKQAVSVTEQLDIVRAAGKWFIFWSERGHAIRAWF
jgi:hypothetical protein